MRLNIVIRSSLAALSLVLSAQCAFAVGDVAVQQAGLAEAAVDKCSQSKSGQPMINCVGDAMSSMSSGLDQGDVRQRAPRIITLSAQAASIRNKPKAAALTVLNRVLAVTRDLASRSKGGELKAYNAVAGAFARALGAVERKG